MPLMMSLKRDWAPRPMPTPRIPAEASSGVGLIVEQAKHLEKADEADDGVGGGAEDSGHGAELGGVAGVAAASGSLLHACDEETDDLPEDRRERRWR